MRARLAGELGWGAPQRCKVSQVFQASRRAGEEPHGKDQLGLSRDRRKAVELSKGVKKTGTTLER